MSIDWTKPIRTVEGHYPCRVMATDLRSNFPIVIRVETGSYEYIKALTKAGSETVSTFKADVENIPEERFVWINVYEGQTPNILCASSNYYSLEEAEKAAQQICNVVGRLKVKLERRFNE